MNRLKIFGVLLLTAIIIYAFIPGLNSAVETGKEVGAGIQFEPSNWNSVMQKAKKENKLIFIDAYTTWCGPCKALKNKTFPNKEVGEYFNKNFINVAFDMESGEGPALAEKYNVDAYPTLIITDASGNLVTYSKGFMSPKQLIDFGKQGLAKKKK